MALLPLLATDLTVRYGERTILSTVNLTVSPGERIGLIGENGSGKSTLLRTLAGTQQPDSGVIQRPDDLGYLAQEMPYPTTATVREVIREALREFYDLVRMVEYLAEGVATDPETVDKYGNAVQNAHDRQAWDADRRMEVALAGLGVSDIPRDRTLGDVSGGQRARLALAALIVRQPSALLIDEPTNHLDDSATDYLASALCQMRGIVLVASHDRVFLDTICTGIVDLDPVVASRPSDVSPPPVRYGGNYSAYRMARRASVIRWEKRYRDEQAELAELRENTQVNARRINHHRPARDNNKMAYSRHGDRVDHQLSRRIRDAERRLRYLENTQVRKPPTPLRFQPPFSQPNQSDGFLISANGVAVPGRLRPTSCTVSSGEHLLITGANGSGKSTLLGILAGSIASSGEVHHRPHVSIGFLPQDTFFHDSQRSASEIYNELVGPETAGYMPLTRLGLLREADANKPVDALSVGQRRRLGLAVAISSSPDLLLLDEPTNHLSPALADELIDALAAASRTVVVASHDRWLREHWQGKILALPSMCD